ncbi:antibiotic biosynthesis monooxygenase [Kribbella sp. NPDC023972]|uniref:antibiotic biosynthesis monooxygenase n=1 Tax=Kribbella sp. NPDC023972 TaxID=3154795 RepID=UPI0033DB29E5
MSGPFIVVSRSRIKPGKAEAYALWCEEFCRYVEQNEPRLLAFNIYETEDRGTSVVVQVHPDAESMEFHLKLYGEKVRETFDHVEVESLDICGAPSETLEQWLRHGVPDLPVALIRVHRAGFTRLEAA